MKREPAYYLDLYKKQILIGTMSVVALILVGVVGINLWLADRREGLVAVEVLTAPSNSKITLDTGEVIGNGTVYLKPGEYTAKVEYEGFHPYEEELIVNEDESVKSYLYVGLGPKTEEAQRWVQWNRRAYGELEIKTREIGVAYTQSLREQYPIIEELPLRDPYFTVGYRASDEHGIIVTVKGTSPRYRQAAIQAIESKGHNLSKYVVEYEGFDNPLADNGETDE